MRERERIGGGRERGRVVNLSVGAEHFFPSRKQAKVAAFDISDVVKEDPKASDYKCSWCRIPGRK